MNMRLATVLPSVATVAVLAACGASSTASDDPSSPPPTQEQVTTSSATAKGHGEALDLRKVEVRVDSSTVAATFTSYRALPLKVFSKPRCGAMGVTWPDQKISLAAPSAFQPNDGATIKTSNVTATQVGPNSIRLTAPRAAFPSGLRSDDAWRSYSAGPACPPLLNELGFLPASGVVHPS
jgi:hypothetical protein